MSEELDKIEPTKCYISINGEKREVKFTFSAWAKLEKKYGSINNIGQIEVDLQERPFEVLPELIYIGLVDKSGIDEDKLETILDDYDMNNITEIADVLNIALSGSLPVDNKKKVVQQKKKQ